MNNRPQGALNSTGYELVSPAVLQAMRRTTGQLRNASNITPLGIATIRRQIATIRNVINPEIEIPHIQDAFQNIRRILDIQAEIANTQIEMANGQNRINRAQIQVNSKQARISHRQNQTADEQTQLNNDNTKTLGAIRKNLDKTKKQYKELTELRKNTASTRSAYFKGMLAGSVLTMAAAAAAYFLLNPKSAQ